MITATFARLKNGDWGIRVPRDAQPGEPCEIKKRDGSVQTTFVGKVLARFDDAAIATMERDESKARDLETEARLKKLADERRTAEAERAIVASRSIGSDLPATYPHNAYGEPLLADGVELYPFQRAGVAYALARFEAGAPGVLIGDEMGLGKTPQAIAVADALVATRVLVVCPASLTVVWQRAFERFSRAGDAIIPKTAYEAARERDHRITIVNYESPLAKSARARGLADALRSTKWDLVIFDEAQYLKNPDSQRTRFYLGHFARSALIQYGLVSSAKRALYLSGTPITNKVRDLLPILRACDAIPLDEKDRKSEWFFLNRYCGPAKVWTGRRAVHTFDGASNLEELQNHLRGTMLVRRLKSEVLTELPPKVRTVVPFELDKPIDPEIDSLSFEDYEPAKVAAEFSIDKLATYRRVLGESKLSHANDYITSLLESGAKVLAFAHHKAVIAGLTREHGDHGMVIDGETATADRQALVDRFQTESECKVAILSTHAAGVGLTLTAAEHVVFVEADWAPHWCQQAEDRAHRIGVQSSVTVHYLTVRDSLDERVMHAMKRKLDIADRALDRGVE